jgi:hypothetical protein
MEHAHEWAVDWSLGLTGAEIDLVMNPEWRAGLVFGGARGVDHNDITQHEEDLFRCDIDTCTSALSQMSIEEKKSESLPGVIAACLNRFFQEKDRLNSREVEEDLTDSTSEQRQNLMDEVFVVHFENVERYIRSRTFFRSLLSIVQTVSMQISYRLTYLS